MKHLSEVETAVDAFGFLCVLCGEFFYYSLFTIHYSTGIPV